MNEYKHPYFLKNELSKRQELNTSYSMRSFAKKLEISPGRLSELLSGKRPVSIKTYIRLLDKLEIDDIKQEILIDDYIKTNLNNVKQEDKYIPIEKKYYHILEDWKYFAIISLLKTKDVQHTPLWISKRLGLLEEDIKQCLKTLINAKIITIENNRFILNQFQITTSHEEFSKSIRKGHRSKLNQAIKSLDETRIEDRDITSMTLPIDSSKLKDAKLLITNFRRKLSFLLEQGNTDEVYSLNIQLVPLTQIKDS